MTSLKFLIIFICVILAGGILALSRGGTKNSVRKRTYVLAKLKEHEIRILFDAAVGILSITNLPGTYFDLQKIGVPRNSDQIVSRYSMKTEDDNYIEYDSDMQKFKSTPTITENTITLVQVPFRRTSFLSRIRPSPTGVLASFDLKYFFSPNDDGIFVPIAYKYETIETVTNITSKNPMIFAATM